MFINLFICLVFWINFFSSQSFSVYKSNFDRREYLTGQINNIHFETIRKSVVKRSVSGPFMLTKIFKGDTKNNYNCVILFKLNSSGPEYQNSAFSLHDDISGLTVSNITSQFKDPSFSISNTGSTLEIIYLYSSNNTLEIDVRYNFQISSISSQLNKIVTFNDNRSNLLTEMACISPATFQDNVNANQLVILFIILGLVLILLLFFIIIITLWKSTSKQDKNEISSEKNSKYENYFLLVDNSQMTIRNDTQGTNEKTFLDALVQDDFRIIEHEVYLLNLNSATKTDEKIKNDFSEFNKTLFNIWLNNVNEKYPSRKSKSDSIRDGVYKIAEEINQASLKEYNEKAKKIAMESISLNKMNLEYLSNNQEEERERIMNLTSSTYKEKIESDLAKVFEHQHHDLISQLKIKENLDMEKLKLTQEELLNSQLNDLYLSAVKEILKNSENNKNLEGISAESASELIKNYLDWQQQLQSIKEKEKIRQLGRLDYIFQKRNNFIKLKENEINDTNEVMEKKNEFFVEMINNLKDREELDGRVCETILLDYEKYKKDLFKEMDTSRRDQNDKMLSLLNQKRNEKLNDLKNQHDNEIVNLLASHSADNNIKSLSDDLKNIESKYYEKVLNEENSHDAEGVNEIIKIHNEISTQTKEKLDSEIILLTKSLKSEGVDSGDIRSILDSYDKRFKSLKNTQNKERERQLMEMNEKIRKFKENIDKNVEKQINEKDQLFQSENNIVEELINIQKTLSEDDRDYILKEYNKHKISTQNSIANSFLEQKRKMEEALALRKAKQLKEIDDKHDLKVEELINRKMRVKTKRTQQEIKEESEKELMLDYVNQKLQLSSVGNSKDDLDKELEIIRNELLAERAALVKKKEEEYVALILKVQMLKAKESAELKDQEEKIFKLQLAALTSSKAQNSQEIFKVYQNTKENLKIELDKNKEIQESTLKEKLENRKRNTLRKKTENEPANDDSETIRRKQQSIEDQKLKNEINMERSIQNVEKDMLKKCISSSDCSREEVFNLMLEIYPLKSSQEIEELVEEFCPKSRQPPQNNQLKSGITLLEAYRKHNEKHKTKASDDSVKIPKISQRNEKNISNYNEKVKVSNEFPNSYDENDGDFVDINEEKIHFKIENKNFAENISNENAENKGRKRKKKSRRKKLDDQENIDDNLEQF